MPLLSAGLKNLEDYLLTIKRIILQEVRYLQGINT